MEQSHWRFVVGHSSPSSRKQSCCHGHEKIVTNVPLSPIVTRVS